MPRLRGKWAKIIENILAIERASFLTGSRNLANRRQAFDNRGFSETRILLTKAARRDSVR